MSEKKRERYKRVFLFFFGTQGSKLYYQGKEQEISHTTLSPAGTDQNDQVTQTYQRLVGPLS
jgi:hypothetical protein